MNPTPKTASTEVTPLVRHQDWVTDLQIGQILRFRFPIKEAGDGDRPKARPCLVLNLRQGLGKRFAELAYGTSAYTKSNKGYEVRVSRLEEAVAAGLTHPTRFIGARRLIVALDNPGFVTGPCGTPLIGQLSGALLERTNTVRARLQADADMAVSVREEHKREVRERLNMPALPLIERRGALPSATLTKRNA